MTTNEKITLGFLNDSLKKYARTNNGKVFVFMKDKAGEVKRILTGGANDTNFNTLEVVKQSTPAALFTMINTGLKAAGAGGIENILLNVEKQIKDDLKPGEMIIITPGKETPDIKKNTKEGLKPVNLSFTN